MQLVDPGRVSREVVDDDTHCRQRLSASWSLSLVGSLCVRGWEL